MKNLYLSKTCFEGQVAQVLLICICIDALDELCVLPKYRVLLSTPKCVLAPSMVEVDYNGQVMNSRPVSPILRPMPSWPKLGRNRLHWLCFKFV